MRTRPAIHLEHTPLVFVVLQVVIAPVLSLKKYIPDLQERFRRNGFPRYREGFISTLSFTDDLSPSVSQSPRFEFYDRDFRTGVLVHPNSLTVQTNKYDSFERFQEIVAMAVGVFRESVEVSLAERVGLRYVDWIRAESGQSPDTLLNPGLHGLTLSEVGSARVLRNFLMNFTTNLGTLLIKLYDQPGKLVPMDSQPTALVYENQPKPEEVVTLLDLDHFAQQSFDFGQDEVNDLAWKLHDPLDLAFREAVTPEARKIWGERI
jgi:uncharacterized protein (TIGR04255 family)